MTAPRLEFTDVEAMIPRVVATGGRLTGLGDYVGREVLVIVLPRKKRSTKEGARRE